MSVDEQYVMEQQNQMSFAECYDIEQNCESFPRSISYPTTRPTDITSNSNKRDGSNQADSEEIDRR